MSKKHLYTPQSVGDLNSDGVVDFVQMYGGSSPSNPESTDEVPGHVLLVSGADGTLLRDSATNSRPLALEMPDSHETHSSPQIVHIGNKTVVIFGTGGERRGGALFRIDLDDLKAGRINNVCFTVLSGINIF